MQKKRFQKPHLLFSLLLVFTIPFYMHIAIWALVLWAVSGFISGIFNFKKNKETLNKQDFAFGTLILLFFLALLYGAFISLNQNKAWSILGGMASVLVIPLVALLNIQLYKENASAIKKAFILGMLTASLIMLGRAAYISFIDEKNNLIYNFTYKRIAFMVQAGYIGFFYITALLLIWFEALISKNKTNFYNRNIPAFLLSAFFILMIFLVSSKAAILSVPLLAVGIFVYFIKEKNRQTRIYSIIGFVIILGIGSYFLLQNKRIQSRIETVEKYSNADEQSQTKEAPKRLIIWKSALETIKESPLKGTGIGDVQDDIGRHFPDFLKDFKYNAHNQFLEVWAGTGIFGLLFFLAFWILFLVNGFRKKNHYAVLYLSLVWFYMLTESLLVRFSGVMPIMFFLMFFWSLNKNEETNLLADNN